MPTPGPPRKPLRIATVSGAAVGTFLLVMLPAIRRIERWHRHINFEIRHAMDGHDVSLPIRLTYGLFHLRESLLPGLRAPLLIAGIVGLAAPMIAARERRMPLALMAIFAVLWYAVHEISPLKPYPNFHRYMVPLAPFLAILAAAFVYELLSRWDRLGVAAAAAVLLAAIPALSSSLRINTPDIDPRDVVPQIVLASGARVALDRYANYSFTNGILGGRARRLAENAEILLTANLTYDRAYNSAVPPNQDIATVAGYYQSLSDKPHLDISNGRPTMAYFNPVLRIIAADGSIERLRQLEKSIKEAAPALELRLVEGMAPR